MNGWSITSCLYFLPFGFILKKAVSLGVIHFLNLPLNYRYWHFPFFESLFFCLSSYIFFLFSDHLALGFILLFTWHLLLLSLIDIEHLLLPDFIIYLLGIIGVIFHYKMHTISVTSILLGGSIGYIALTLFSQCYTQFRGKEGLGYGDIKLFSILGFWLGIEALIPVLMLAALGGIVFGTLWIYIKKKNIQIPLPFGPFLAVSGWLHLLMQFNIDLYPLTFLL